MYRIMKYIWILFFYSSVHAITYSAVTNEVAYKSSDVVLVIEAENKIDDGKIPYKPLYFVKGGHKYGMSICVDENALVYREKRVLESEAPSVVFLSRSSGGCFYITRSFPFIKGTNCLDVENIFIFPEVTPYQGEDESFETFIALVSDNKVSVPYWLTDYRKQCRKVVDGRVVK